MEKNTKKTGIIIGIILFVVVLSSLVLAYNMRDTQDEKYTKTEDTVATSTIKTFKIEEVITHNNKDDCWSVIRGGVYDLTSWIPKHPGGEKAILFICGKEATDLFDKQHKGQGKPENALTNFKIGEIM